LRDLARKGMEFKGGFFSKAGGEGIHGVGLEINWIEKFGEEGNVFL
jgi:hypothetical protein